MTENREESQKLLEAEVWKICKKPGEHNDLLCKCTDCVKNQTKNQQYLFTRKVNEKQNEIT